MIFFLLSEDLSIGRILSEKKILGYGVNSEKKEALYVTKEQKQPPGVILQQLNFLQCLFCACAEESSEDPVKGLSS